MVERDVSVLGMRWWNAGPGTRRPFHRWFLVPLARISRAVDKRHDVVDNGPIRHSLTVDATTAPRRSACRRTLVRDVAERSVRERRHHPRLYGDSRFSRRDGVEHLGVDRTDPREKTLVIHTSGFQPHHARAGSDRESPGRAWRHVQMNPMAALRHRSR